MANTKRALLTSMLAIVACVAMLIGSTFAWFTDTASTGVNKITSGTLHVEIQNKEDKPIDTLEWVKEDGTAIEKQEDILWEPGCTYLLTPFKIVNTGTLALKYKIVITGLDSGSPLLDVIKFTYKTAAGETFDMNAEGHLTAKGTDGASTDVITISAHMDKNAGNDYQGKTLEGVKFTVYATQDTVESDSFNNQYDKNAQYDDVDYSHATDSGSLKDVLKESQNSEKPSYVDLNEGAFSLDSEDTIGANTTLAGSGIGKTTLNAEKVSVKKDDVVIKDMTIKGKAPAGNDGALNVGGKNTTIENVKFVGQGFNGDTKGISVSGEDLTIKNSHISNAFRGIIFWDNIGGNNVIENCVIDNVIYTFNINAATVKPGTTLTVKNSTLNGWTSYAGCMQKVSFENCDLGQSYGYAYLVAYADSAFTDCTFHDGYQIAAGSTGKTLTFTNCKLADGTVITAENFAEKLGDVDAALKSCTVIVDGTTVNWN